MPPCHNSHHTVSLKGTSCDWVGLAPITTILQSHLTQVGKHNFSIKYGVNFHLLQSPINEFLEPAPLYRDADSGPTAKFTNVSLLNGPIAENGTEWPYFRSHEHWQY